MNTRKLSSTNSMRRSRRRVVASALVAPVMALSSACGDSSPVDVGEDLSFLEEVFDVTVETDVQYGEAVDEDGLPQALLLNLFQPTNDPRPLRPAVIWVHGGSYIRGHRGEMTEFARSSARRGFVSVSVDYRLRENADVDYADPNDPLAEVVKHDAQHDVQAAVRWIRAHESDLKIHPTHIYVAGYSAGGTAALRVAANSNDPGSSGNPGPSSTVAAAVAISGSLEPGILDAAVGPTLLIHGENDAKVPIAGIEAACAAVSRCRLVSIPLGEHTLLGFAKETIISETASFLHGEVTAP
jgi:dienelactone hydrolase